MSISLDPELSEEVRKAATKKDTSASARLAEAARAQLRQEELACVPG